MRTPGAEDGSTIRLPLPEARQDREEGCADEEDDRQTDGRVRQVERVEAQISDPDVDEIDHVPDPKPVHEIADRAAEQKTECDRHVEAPSRSAMVRDDEADDGKGDDPEQHRVIAEQAEQGARVLAEDQANPITDELDDLARRDVRDQPGLGDLIDDDDRAGDREEDQPVSTGADRGRDDFAAGGHVRPCLRHPDAPAGLTRRRRAMETRPPPSSTSAVRASGGASPEARTASVSATTPGRCADSPSATGSTHRSMRSSSCSWASRRSSWMARASSRASPSATSSGVSVVSRTTTSPS